MLMTIAALYAGKKILDHATKNTAAAAGAAASAAVVGATIAASNNKKADQRYVANNNVNNYPNNVNQTVNHVETKIIEKVPVPVLVTQKCISCRAYVTGYTDEIIKCEYCDTEQNVSKDNEEKN